MPSPWWLSRKYTKILFFTRNVAWWLALYLGAWQGGANRREALESLPGDLGVRLNAWRWRGDGLGGR